MPTVQKQLVVALLALFLLIGCQKKTDQQTATAPTDSSNQPRQPTVAAGFNPVPSPSGDFLIVAGERVGPIRANSTQDELLRALGDVVTARDSIFDAEGNVTIGTTLYKRTVNQVHILWTVTEAT